MARQRFILPSIWEDEKVSGELSAEEELLFIGCFSNADDEGRMVGNAANLRAVAFRYRDYTIAQVAAMRDRIAATCKNFHVYSVDGQAYIQFLKWSTFQHPKYPTPSKLPPPPGYSRNAEGVWVHGSSNLGGSLPQHSPSVPPMVDQDSPNVPPALGEFSPRVDLPVGVSSPGFEVGCPTSGGVLLSGSGWDGSGRDGSNGDGKGVPSSVLSQSESPSDAATAPTSVAVAASPSANGKPYWEQIQESDPVASVLHRVLDRMAGPKEYGKRNERVFSFIAGQKAMHSPDSLQLAVADLVARESGKDRCRDESHVFAYVSQRARAHHKAAAVRDPPAEPRPFYDRPLETAGDFNPDDDDPEIAGVEVPEDL